MNLRILALGAGVQSTALALMIEKGEFEKIDCAIFADTGSEPKKVYDHLDWLETVLSYPIYRVSQGNLKNDLIKSANHQKSRGSVPAFTKNIETGNKGILRRQCTQEYKIKPLLSKIRELLGVGYKERVPKGVKVEQIFGISLDEMIRMRISPIKYIDYSYPLVDKRLRRYDCLQWIEKNNFPKPPRSACTFCPYHSNEEWKIIKENPDEWKEVIELDKTIRNGLNGTKDQLFLHKSLVPLDEADLDPNKDQQDLFNDICDSAICGV